MIEEESIDTVVFCGLSETGYRHYMESQSIPMSQTTYLHNYDVLQQVLSGYEVPLDLHESFLGDLTPEWGKAGVNTSFFYDDAEAYGEYVVEARLNGEEWQDYVVLPGGLVLVRDPSIMEVLEVYKDRVKGRIMSVLRENTLDARTFGRENYIAQPDPHETSIIDEILLENVREKVLATLTEEKLLREVDEDEMVHIQDVLDSMGERELAFNHLFGEKVRKVVDFETMDDDTEFYKLSEIMRDRLNVRVDWKTGIVSGEREITDYDNELTNLVNMLADNKPMPEKKVKKFQMKINKYFNKVEGLYRQMTDARMTIVRKKHNNSEMHSSPFISLTGKDISDNTSPEELKRYHQILQGLELYTGRAGMNAELYNAMPMKERDGSQPYSILPKWATWWRDNAGYVKKNYDELFGDKYAMILTRHPIDVLRMSDFSSIYSCHSPPSHPHHDSSYYRCAVAEAHGHGAIAYVVNKEELLINTNTETLEAAEEEIQDGEIFGDERRRGSAGFDIEPISRLRLRQVRYYNDPDDAKRHDEGKELAVPEVRVYGEKIPGIRDRVVKWVKEGQPLSLEDLPASEYYDDKAGANKPAVDLTKFVKFGGSYEDNNVRALISAILPDGATVTGYPTEDTETEDHLPDGLGNMVQQLENECEPVIDKWNSTYANVELEARYEDDGAEGAYAIVTGEYKFQIPLEEVGSVPNYKHHEWITDELNQFDLSGAMQRQHERNRRAGYGYRPEREHIETFTYYGGMTTRTDSSGERYLVIRFRLNMEAFDDNGNGFFSDAGSLEDTCVAINEMDDKEETITHVVKQYLKREGFISGGVYMQLAREIEDGDFSSYEWDVESDGQYEDSYESTAQYTYHYDYTEAPFKFNPEVLKKILDSREYRTQLRSNLLDSPRRGTGSDYYLDIDSFGTDVVGDYVRVFIRFKVTADDPDERVELFKELVTGTMDDEDNLTVVFNKTLAQINDQRTSGQRTEPDEDIKENKVRKGDYMSNWRSFITS